MQRLQAVAANPDQSASSSSLPSYSRQGADESSSRQASGSNKRLKLDNRSIGPSITIPSSPTRPSTLGVDSVTFTTSRDSRDLDVGKKVKHHCFVIDESNQDGLDPMAEFVKRLGLESVYGTAREKATEWMHGGDNEGDKGLEAIANAVFAESYTKLEDLEKTKIGEVYSLQYMANTVRMDDRHCT